jgi:ABC-2 type transport system permease protein
VSLRHLLAVTRKEILHIFRDRMTLFLVFLAPALLLFIMAYALSVEIQHVPVAVLDYDRSAVSRSFIQQITAGEDLELHSQVNSMHEINNLLMRGEIKAALVIGPSFGRDLQAMRGIPIQIIIDGTEPQSGGFAMEHISRRAEEFINQALSTQIEAIGGSSNSIRPIDLRVRTWYNPGLEPRVDLIPGLLSIVLGFPALSVALTISHEREHGTLEQLMATPISRPELLLGKMIPYIIVGMVNAILLPLIAILWFDIPFNGNFLLYFMLTCIFIFAMLSMGIIIGVFMPTQPAALALSFLLIFFPGFFLTGIFFPVAAMPEIVRMESLALPGTHYAIITRGTFLTGVGLDVLWPYGVMLFILGWVFVAIAALFFRKKLG